MTNKELSQIYYLKKEMKFIIERLEELQTRATKVTSNISAQPTGSGGFAGASFENNVDKRIELEKRLAELKQRINTETLRIQDYIYNIDDSLMRMIITLRCINCYSWVKVAMTIGGNNTADGVKMMYHRYIRNH